ncbi:hypothetical protein ACQP1G_33795 [Nocardia sp. CA-107356]|uniref:hypothetical protein n=1 Tax=Nocardia sp. CA-107356 TaxID=3239972 RepID=UPI003D8DF4C5
MAPSVAALLATFHAETWKKLALAPVDGVVLLHTASGIVVVYADGWLEDYDDSDAGDSTM